MSGPATRPRPPFWEAKELLIEYASQVYINDTLTLTAIDPRKLASFDPDQLFEVDDGAPLYTGPDLHVTLEAGAMSHYREKSMQEFYNTHFKNIPQGLLAQSFQDGVADLLEKELAKLGYQKDLFEDHLSKARALAIHRSKDGLIPFDSMEFQEESLEDRAKHEFDVLLVTLRGGFPGNIDTQRLYFDFSTEYHTFLAELQDASQLSVIPSVDVKLTKTTSSSVEFDDEVGPNQQNALGIIHPSPTNPLAVGSGSSLRQSLKEKITDRGFTVAHGPWLYRVVRNLEVISVRQKNGVDDWNREIGKDRSSYLTMVDLVKAARRKTPDENITVLIKHSLDEEACTRWRKYLADEAAEDQRSRDDLRANGLDEEIGEPFMASWWKRKADENAIITENGIAAAHAEHVFQALQEERIRSTQEHSGRYSPDYVQQAITGDVSTLREKLERAKTDAIKKRKDEVVFEKSLRGLWT
ncbi:hypothetical protein BUE80_DR001991 [Diplocarpon rosae]|nr:hypothetical protein BUE80_DR001991 [Diplocarpon rosae]